MRSDCEFFFVYGCLERNVCVLRDFVAFIISYVTFRYIGEIFLKFGRRFSLILLNIHVMRLIRICFIVLII